MKRRRSEVFAIINQQAAEIGRAEIMCLLQHRVEHRREVAGRGIDDLQHLGGRGLLLQRLVTLGVALSKLPLEFRDELLRIV